jgi:hypothetical protein
MKRNEIIAEINNRGFVAQATTAIKNGIEKEAISIRQHSDDKVAVNLYPADFVGSATEIAEEMIAIYQRSNCDFDLSVFSDKEYILSHVRLGLQATGTEEIIKRPSNFEGLEEYLYISGNRGEEHFSVKLKKEMLVKADVALNIAWSMAEKNSHEETTIQPLMSLVANMVGEENICNELAPIYVVSNKSNYRGASAIADRRALKQLADNIGIHEFVLLPSSIHECIIVPKTKDTDMKMFENMVNEVNSTVVSPEDKLIDRVYTLTA